MILSSAEAAEVSVRTSALILFGFQEKRRVQDVWVQGFRD